MRSTRINREKARLEVRIFTVSNLQEELGKDQAQREHFVSIDEGLLGN